MDVRLVEQAEAAELLRCAEFARAWDRLHAACPWSTSFQSRAFARAWFESYADEVAPLFLLAGEGSGLQGLLALGRDRGTGDLLNLGGHQAEYHCWLSDPASGAAFIVQALERLRRACPGASLRFRYLPPGAPLAWLDAHPQLARLAEARPVPRPLLDLDEEAVLAAKLRKKGNRSRLNRLRDACGGELAGETIADPAALAEVMGDIANAYDCRQGEANGVRPFADDPRKSGFYLALLRHGLLHAFLLRAGGRYVGAVLSVRDADLLSVGVFSHAADLAHLSPGKFVMLLLARDAARAGCRTIDLTPGGAWKDRFASRFDTVTDLTFRFCPRQAARVRRRRRLEAAAKSMLGSIGVTPQRARRLANRVGLRL